MQIKQIKNTENEIVSLEETKRYMRIDHNADDDFIKDLIPATREAMESVIQKSILKSGWEYIVEGKNIGNMRFGDSNYPRVLSNVVTIPLPKPPVLKITKVSIIKPTGEEVELNEEKFSLEQIGACFCAEIIVPERLNLKKCAIKINYESGISEDPENIPYQLKLANLMLVANAYKERFCYNVASFMPSGVQQLLAPFKTLRVL